jgi:hypothetical protein
MEWAECLLLGANRITVPTDQTLCVPSFPRPTSNRFLPPPLPLNQSDQTCNLVPQQQSIYRTIPHLLPTSLTSLQLRWNSLRGALQEFGNFGKLASLALSTNRFVGTLPV